MNLRMLYLKLVPLLMGLFFIYGYVVPHLVSMPSTFYFLLGAAIGVLTPPVFVGLILSFSKKGAENEDENENV